MHSDYGATTILNIADMTITCCCRKFESIGMYIHQIIILVVVHYIADHYLQFLSGILCNHAFKVFNMNDVFILPSQYILNRWTKYAKRGHYVEKKGRPNENLKARAARISRIATSLALKCATSEPLLDDLERALENLESMVDDSLNKMRKNEDSFVGLNDHDICTQNNVISFRVPHVVKGPKSKRAKNVVEKNTRKKKKSHQEKGIGLLLQ
jgi:type IV secretory pathway VirB4 component